MPKNKDGGDSLNLRVLFLVFLCFFGVSIISNAAATTVKAATEPSYEAFADMAPSTYSMSNGTEPAGDPGGPGWPS